jgi:glutamate dehydrogenase
MRLLEGRGLLDRAVEGLPDDEAVRALSRAGLGLTRPELAVLLAYAKIALNQSLLDSTVPDDPGFAGDLARYFPKPVRERFPEAIEAHRLRRALVATILANDTVNRTGPATIALIAEASGATLAQAARAAAIAIGAFRLDALFDRINALDGKVASAVQTSMHRDVAALIERQTHWLIAHVAPDAPVDETAARFRNGIDALKGTFAGLVSPVEREPVEARIAELEAAGVPGDLADEAGALGLLEATPDIVLLAGETSAPLDAVAGAYFAAGSSLGIDRLRQASAAIRPQGHWETLALARASDDLYAIQRKAAARAIAGLHNWAGAGRAEGAGAVKSWVALQGEAVNRPLKLIAELTRDGAFSAAKLGLCAGQLRDAVG